MVNDLGMETDMSMESKTFQDLQLVKSLTSKLVSVAGCEKCLALISTSHKISQVSRMKSTARRISAPLSHRRGGLHSW